MKRKHKSTKYQKGFTLIDLLTVISIITLISSTITVRAFAAVVKGRNAAIVSNIKQFHTWNEMYYQNHSHYVEPNCGASTCKICSNRSNPYWNWPATDGSGEPLPFQGGFPSLNKKNNFGGCMIYYGEIDYENEIGYEIDFPLYYTGEEGLINLNKQIAAIFSMPVDNYIDGPCQWYDDDVASCDIQYVVPK